MLVAELHNAAKKHLSGLLLCDFILQTPMATDSNGHILPDIVANLRTMLNVAHSMAPSTDAKVQLQNILDAMSPSGVMLRKIGTILPEGNKSEFEDIRKELRRLKVEWFERKIGQSRGIVFWFYESELSKLPSHPESQGQSKFSEYLPVDEESGHSISIIESLLERYPGEDVVNK